MCSGIKEATLSLALLLSCVTVECPLTSLWFFFSHLLNGLGWCKCNCGYRPWVLIIISRLKHIFINQNRNHYAINTFLPMQNKLVYSCSVKIHVSGFDKLLESIFCLLLVLEVFSLQKVFEMLEEVVVSWWEVRYRGGKTSKPD